MKEKVKAAYQLIDQRLPAMGNLNRRIYYRHSGSSVYDNPDPKNQ
jgi:hypothetical protein